MCAPTHTIAAVPTPMFNAQAPASSSLLVSSTSPDARVLENGLTFCWLGTVNQSRFFLQCMAMPVIMHRFEFHFSALFAVVPSKCIRKNVVLDAAKDGDHSVQVCCFLVCCFAP